MKLFITMTALAALSACVNTGNINDCKLPEKPVNCRVVNGERICSCERGERGTFERPAAQTPSVPDREPDSRTDPEGYQRWKDARS